MSNTVPKRLPQPTTDSELAKSQLDEFGYCFVKDAMSQAQVAALRTRLEEQAMAEKSQGLAFEDGGAKQGWGEFRDEQGNLRRQAFTEAAGGRNQRVWMLVNKGQIFLDVLTIQSVRSLVDHILGDDYLLSSYGANIAKPGGVAMDLHTDQWWMPAPIYRSPSPVPAGSISRQRWNIRNDEELPMIPPCVCVNVMWMLNDFTEANGGTRLVPESHLSGRRPHKERDKDVKSIAAEGPAGTAMIFDGRIWHGTGANVSDEFRWGMLSTFCGPQFRPQENFTVGISPEVYENASPELLALLGFKIWNAYGRIESPTAEFITYGEGSLGEMSPEMNSD